MWTPHPKHKIAKSGFLFHRTPFDREYPHPLNDFFWRVYLKENLQDPIHWINDSRPLDIPLIHQHFLPVFHLLVSYNTIYMGIMINIKMAHVNQRALKYMPLRGEFCRPDKIFKTYRRKCGHLVKGMHCLTEKKVEPKLLHPGAVFFLCKPKRLHPWSQNGSTNEGGAVSDLFQAKMAPPLKVAPKYCHGQS